MLAYTFDVLRLVFTALRVPVVFDLLISASRLIASVEGSTKSASEHRSIDDTFGLTTLRR